MPRPELWFLDHLEPDVSKSLKDSIALAPDGQRYEQTILNFMERHDYKESEANKLKRILKIDQVINDFEETRARRS